MGKCLVLYLFSCSCLLLAQVSLTAASGSEIAGLTGRITDKRTGLPLPGASIYFPDLRKGGVAGADGTYRVDYLPSVRAVVQVSAVGYQSVTRVVDLETTTVADFALTESITELKEVVVTGQSGATEKTRAPTPVAVLSRAAIQERVASNLVEVIASQPGIAQITTGPGISKPVIRGLGYNRVVVVNDGIRQEGQQWGDEHGLEVDEYAVDKVEILKGPASLAYGSDAMAGVINLIAAPTLPEGTMEGSVTANYQHNPGLWAASVNLAGNRRGAVWDLHYTRKAAHAYRNAYDGHVFNSGFREESFSGIAGINRSWGYSHLHISSYDQRPGIVEGARDSATGRFVREAALNDSTVVQRIVTGQEALSYTLRVPYQRVRHAKVVLNNSVILGQGSLKTILGWQQNQRQEFADALTPDAFGLYFRLNTYHYDLRYVLPEYRKLNLSAGVNGMYQVSGNLGSEYLVPEYGLFDAGAFVLGKRNFGSLDLSGGLRYDTRRIRGRDLFLDAAGNKTTGSDPAAIQRFGAFDATFSGFSGSLGAALQFAEHYFAKFNVSRGFRAPNIAELGSNGHHDGTIRYEIGNVGLKPEGSWQFDAATGISSDHLTAELDLFSNRVDNFIFSEKLRAAGGGDSISDGFQTYRFASGRAQLWGGELSVDLHPHPFDWLHFENTFSFVRSTLAGQPDSTRYLPLTPPPRFTSVLRATGRKLGRHIANAFARAGVECFWAQHRYYAANGTETATPGYVLVDVGFGGDVVVRGKTLVQLICTIGNLLDATYQSHLSRLKYAPVNPATGRSGVFNMGRNVSVKLVVPFDYRFRN